MMQHSRPASILFLSALLFAALFFGLFGAVAGWYLQLVAISAFLPIVLVALDYRFGLVLIILFMPYAGSPLLPKAGPISMINVLILGVFLSWFLRAILSSMAGRKIALPVPRELLWFYVLPITLAAIIGSFYLDQIPAHLLLDRRYADYGLWDYWVSLYLKSLLLVMASCILGSAVIKYGRAGGFAVWVVVSAVIYTSLIFVVIGLSGVSLSQLKDVRNFLIPLGLHNNPAAYLLIVPFANALFMAELTKSRKAKVAFFVAAVFIGVGVVFTFSRGGFVGILTVLLCYVLYFKRIRLGFLAIFVGLVVIVAAPSAVRDRLMTGLDDSSISEQVQSKNKDELTAGRVYLWQNLAPEILKSPVFGRGIDSGMWSDFVKSGSVFANAHNLYLATLMDLGVVGAILMALFCRYIWRLFLSLFHDERLSSGLRGYFLGAAMGLAGLLVAGVAFGAYLPLNFLLFLWISIGLALGCSAYLKSDQNNQLS